MDYGGKGEDMGEGVISVEDRGFALGSEAESRSIQLPRPPFRFNLFYCANSEVTSNPVSTQGLKIPLTFLGLSPGLSYALSGGSVAAVCFLGISAQHIFYQTVKLERFLKFPNKNIASPAVWEIEWEIDILFSRSLGWKRIRSIG